MRTLSWAYLRMRTSQLSHWVCPTVFPYSQLLEQICYVLLTSTTVPGKHSISLPLLPPRIFKISVWENSLKKVTEGSQCTGSLWTKSQRSRSLKQYSTHRGLENILPGQSYHQSTATPKPVHIPGFWLTCGTLSLVTSSTLWLYQRTQQTASPC